MDGSVRPAGGLVVTGDDGVPTMGGVPLGAEAQRMMAGDGEGGQQVQLRAPLNAVQEWLSGQQETREFRRRVGVASGPLATVQRHLAQAQAADVAEARAEAHRVEQARADRVERLQAMTAESGLSLEELSRNRQIERMVAERREQQAFDDAQAERVERAQSQQAALFMSGHRPRTLAEILAGAAMFA